MKTSSTTKFAIRTLGYKRLSYLAMIANKWFIAFCVRPSLLQNPLSSPTEPIKKAKQGLHRWQAAWQDQTGSDGQTKKAGINPASLVSRDERCCSPLHEASDTSS
jgi:hypothetical protein